MTVIMLSHLHFSLTPLYTLSDFSWRRLKPCFTTVIYFFAFYSILEFNQDMHTTWPILILSLQLAYSSKLAEEIPGNISVWWGSWDSKTTRFCWLLCSSILSSQLIIDLTSYFMEKFMASSIISIIQVLMIVIIFTRKTRTQKGQ